MLLLPLVLVVMGENKWWWAKVKPGRCSVHLWPVTGKLACFCRKSFFDVFCHCFGGIKSWRMKSIYKNKDFVSYYFMWNLKKIYHFHIFHFYTDSYWPVYVISQRESAQKLTGVVNKVALFRYNISCGGTLLVCNDCQGPTPSHCRFLNAILVFLPCFLTHWT